MEAQGIKVGKVYDIKVGKNTVAIRITKTADEGGWHAVSLSTNKPLVIKSAERIVGLHAAQTEQNPAKAAKQVLDSISKPLRKLSALDAAAKVLAEAKEPLNCKQMIDTMLAEGYWEPSHAGKTPANTLHAAIGAEIKKKGDQARFEKVGRGQFALRTTV